MTDLENILPLWHELEASGSDYVLATVVDVDGPSYRKPGARMLLAQDGRRAGTVSGGCLEAEVAKRAWWLTESGPRCERYSTAEDDGDMPYGSGCGGVVYVLLERRATAASLLTKLEAAFHARVAISDCDNSRWCRHRYPSVRRTDCARWSELDRATSESSAAILRNLAALALDRMQSIDQRVTVDGNRNARLGRLSCRPARLVDLWRGRRCKAASSPGTRTRMVRFDRGWTQSSGYAEIAFPPRTRCTALPISTLPEAASSLLSDVKSTDAAVLLTHSFEQDSYLLASLLAREVQPAYIGVLGPAAKNARGSGRGGETAWTG